MSLDLIGRVSFEITANSGGAANIIYVFMSAVLLEHFRHKLVWALTIIVSIQL
jgi:hypothetical protein